MSSSADERPGTARPGALTCAKLRRFVQGDASEPTISLHRVHSRPLLRQGLVAAQTGPGWNVAGAFFLPDTAPGTPAAKVIEDVKEETVSCVQ